MGATTSVVNLLNTGDHIVCVDDVYGGTYRYFRRVVSRMGIDTTFVDGTDVSNVEKALKPNTKLVWMETPTNPLMKVCDIKKTADVVHKRKDIILVVDNSFLTCYFQLPLTLGADIVSYSVTKYLNGHTDIVMGALAMNCNELYERLKFLQNAMGIVPSPFDCALVNRSLKTLHVRMEEHQKNGFAVAKFLENHPLVEKVIHPGLPSHPQYEVTKRQTFGHSGMLSMYLKGGLEESRKFLTALKVFILAESLGGYKSLAELPSLMTHASIPEEERIKNGITDNLIRLSVGIESRDDLIDDLDQALIAMAKK